MFTRSNMISKLELTIQQEIKNYQDSLNAILQSIRDLKNQVARNREDYLLENAKLRSDHQELKSKYFDISRDAQITSHQLKSHIVNQKTITDSLEEDVSFLTKDLLSLLGDKRCQNSNVQELKQELSDLKQEVADNRAVSNDNLDDLLRRLRREMESIKKEILDAPTEAKAIKTQLEEKFSCHLVDVDGIMRELRIYKHDNMVTQKKIEQIYAFIDRLKNYQEVNCEPSINH